MRRSPAFPALAWIGALLFPTWALVAQPEGDAALSPTSLRTIEGRVLGLREHRGESELVVVTATLVTEGTESEGLQVLLAPASALAEAGFEVAEGDLLRLRIFVSAEGPARAQKVRNLSRQTMIRLRTLHQVPAWDAAGHWQGDHGPMRPGHGGGQPGRRGPPN